MNKNIIRPVFEHRFLLFVAFFCTTASAKQIRGVADYIYPVALIATAAQYFYSSPERAEIRETTKEKPNIYAMSDGALHITGSQPRPVGKTACEPVTDIDGEKKWQCFGSENHYAAVELPFSQPSQPDKAIRIGIFNNPEQQVLIYYGAVLPEAFSGQHLYDAGKAVSGSAERQRRIEREASERKRMLRIRKSYGDQPDARYLHLQTIDGISVQERKELESRLRLGQDNGESDSRNDLKMHADQLMQSFNGDSFIPVDTSFCNSETKAACQEILSHITTLGNTNSVSGTSSGDQAAAGDSGTSGDGGEHAEPQSADDLLRALRHSEPDNFLEENRNVLANYLRRSFEGVEGVVRCDTSFREHADGSYNIDLDVFDCCPSEDLQLENGKCRHNSLMSVTYRSADIDGQKSAAMCIKALLNDHETDRAMLVEKIKYPAAWDANTELYIGHWNFHEDAITLTTHYGACTAIKLSNVFDVTDKEIKWDQFIEELEMNGLSFVELMDAAKARKGRRGRRKRITPMEDLRVEDLRIEEYLSLPTSHDEPLSSSAAILPASGHAGEYNALRRNLVHLEPGNFLEKNRNPLANYLRRSFEEIKGVARSYVCCKKHPDGGYSIDVDVFDCCCSESLLVENGPCGHDSFESCTYQSADIDGKENAEMCLKTLLNDHWTDRAMLATKIDSPAAWNANTELHIQAWDYHEDTITLEWHSGECRTIKLSNVVDSGNREINWGQFKEELKRNKLSYETLMDSTQVKEANSVIPSDL